MVRVSALFAALALNDVADGLDSTSKGRARKKTYAAKTRDIRIPFSECPVVSVSEARAKGLGNLRSSEKPPGGFNTKGRKQGVPFRNRGPKTAESTDADEVYRYFTAEAAYFMSEVFWTPFGAVYDRQVLGNVGELLGSHDWQFVTGQRADELLSKHNLSYLAFALPCVE